MKTKTSTTPNTNTDISITTQSIETIKTTTHRSTTIRNNDGYAILLTGGLSDRHRNATLHSAEIFLTKSPNSPCLLPDLPVRTFGHTQDGGLMCGGLYSHNYCRQWNSTEGKFPKSPAHEVTPGRYYHVSWTPVSGKETYLIGGVNAHRSASIVKPGKFSLAEGFNLKNPLSTGACAIPDPDTDTILITGGHFQNRITTLYNKTGFVEDFGNLYYDRNEHGCASFVADAKRV